jgi:4-carboxymuconolactone decarboxylase
MHTTDRYTIGLEQLKKISGEGDPAIVDSLREVAPDLVRMVIEFGYGDINARPGLSLRHRQLATVVALAAMGHARPQLEFHIAGALHIGIPALEIVECLLQVVPCAGFPAALNGVFAAKTVLAARGELPIEPLATSYTESDRFVRGSQALDTVDGSAGEAVIESLRDIAPDLGRFIVEFGFGDLFSRPLPDPVTREITTVAAFTALGTCLPQLRVHAHGLLNVGGSREMLVETVMQMAVYAGFPAALNAMFVVSGVLAERTVGAPR